MALHMECVYAYIYVCTYVWLEECKQQSPQILHISIAFNSSLGNDTWSGQLTCSFLSHKDGGTRSLEGSVWVR